MHVAFFLSIVEEPATYHTDISETEETSKMSRSLPPSFDPLAIVSSNHEISFEKVVKVVKTELARRSNSPIRNHSANYLKVERKTLPTQGDQ